MAFFGFGGRREDRLGELLAVLQVFRQGDAADGAVLLVFLPARAGDVATHHEFNRNHAAGAAVHHAAITTGLLVIGEAGD